MASSISESEQIYKNLSDQERQDLYRNLIKEAQCAVESNDIEQLKKLSEIAVAIEEASSTNLIKIFDAENPLREANIVVENNGKANYLFSLGGSSKLYDLMENTNEAIFQAIKSNDVELVKHLLLILLSDDPNKIINEKLTQLKEAIQLLSGVYKEKLSKDMKNYLERKIRFYSFLCDFNVNENPVEWFVNRSEIDCGIDIFLLSLIKKEIKEEVLLSEIDNMIELLKKHEEFYELEYKIRRLKSEFESGKSKYTAAVIQTSIEEREKEMHNIEIRSRDLISEKKKLVEHLESFN
ncbi:hypothetical protein [Wolbachia pipientis]|uniref:hypothetical protein n=1 Tax=Wolbachia pipientis TaxID=955 RepID=UPI0020B75C83|nr:hypothetical protein [Wolbachia pipientis]